MIVMDLPGVGAESESRDTIPGMAAQTIGIIKALGCNKINLLDYLWWNDVQEIVRLDGSL